MEFWLWRCCSVGLGAVGVLSCRGLFVFVDRKNAGGSEKKTKKTVEKSQLSNVDKNATAVGFGRKLRERLPENAIERVYFFFLLDKLLPIGKYR